MASTALNRTTVALLTNKSGGAVAQGDVVIVDSATAAAFTTTTSAAYASGSVGVVLEPNGIANNATGIVAFGGYVPKINLSSSASLADVFRTHSVAKQAVRHAAPLVAGDFGQVLGTGTSPAAFLFNQPTAAASGGSTTLAGDSDVSISSPAAGDLLQYSGSAWQNYNLDTARYHQASGTLQSLTSAVTTIVNYDTQDWDSNSCVTTGASWKFTATKTGKYRVSAALILVSANYTSGQSVDLTLYKNGVLQSELMRWQPGVAVTSMLPMVGGADVVSLVATDYIDVRVYQNTGGPVTLFGDSKYNYVNVELMP